MLWKKSRALVEDLYGLFTICNSGVEEFGNGLSLFCANGVCESFLDSVSVIKAWETRADEQVRQIKSSLFGNFLLPEAREDIARLLNTTDDIIDNATHGLKFVALRGLAPVPELTEHAAELYQATMACFNAYRNAAQGMFEPNNGSRVRDLVEETGRFETICDDIENRMVTLLYTLPLDPFTRILQSDFIRHIGNISNACEDAASVVGIMNLKRVV